MNKARLEKLLVALEGVKPKDFDMGRYTHPCGTPACVFGHFASRPDLQSKFVLEKCEDGSVICLKGTNNIVDHWDEAVHKYFGITEQQSEYLFGVDRNEGATPAQMRRRIRRFIDNAKRA